MEWLLWVGIGFCISQSAIFSGLNLAFFSLTRLRLEIEAEASNSRAAQKVLKMRRDSNFLLTTILWGNVGINVLLTLLSDSVLAGVGAFLFSTIIITLFGEIVPQAYFSRNALKMASILSPLLRVYQFLLYPVAKPSALLLDLWLGREAVQYFAENKLKLFIEKHVDGDTNEIGRTEGMGAINFLSVDDMRIVDEGETINKDSIVKISFLAGKPQFPTISASPKDPFLQQVHRSGEKWVVFVDEEENPRLVLDADGYLRSVLFDDNNDAILQYCHAPITLLDNDIPIGTLLKTIRSGYDKKSDQPIKKDVVLLWGKTRKVITGADLLGRLLRGI